MNLIKKTAESIIIFPLNNGIQLGERPDELLKLVAAKLFPEDNLLLKEYDDIWFQQICRRDELIYSTALMDGILLGYWVAMVGQGIEKIKV